jgi:hypothetical protein
MGTVPELHIQSSPIHQGTNDVKRIAAIPLGACAVGLCPQRVRQVSMQAASFENVHVLKSPANAQSRKMKPMNPAEQVLFQCISIQVDVAANQRVFRLSVTGGVDVCSPRE